MHKNGYNRTKLTPIYISDQEFYQLFIASAAVANDVPEEYSDEDHEGGEDPYDEDPLVENVVEGEPHVSRQLLQAAHIFLHLEGTLISVCIFTEFWDRQAYSLTRNVKTEFAIYGLIFTECWVQTSIFSKS